MKADMGMEVFEKVLGDGRRVEAHVHPSKAYPGNCTIGYYLEGKPIKRTQVMRLSEAAMTLADGGYTRKQPNPDPNAPGGLNDPRR